MKLVLLLILTLSSFSAFANVEKLNFKFSKNDQFEDWKVHVHTKWNTRKDSPFCKSIVPNVDLWSGDFELKTKPKKRDKYNAIKFKNSTAKYSQRIDTHGSCQWGLMTYVNVVITSEISKTKMSPLLTFLNKADADLLRESEKVLNVSEIKEIRISNYYEDVTMSWAGGETKVDAGISIIGKDDTLLKECVTEELHCTTFFFNKAVNNKSQEIPLIIFE